MLDLNASVDVRVPADERARWWDDFFGDTSHDDLDGWDSEELCNKVAQHLPRGTKVLWLGVTYGAGPVRLAKSGYKVLAVDISKKAIEIATALAEAEGLRKNEITFLNRAAENMEAPSGSYDGVVCPAMLNYLCDYAAVAQVMSRMQAATASGGLHFLSEPLWAGRVIYAYRDWSVPLYLFREHELIGLYDSDWQIIESYKVPEKYNTTRLCLVVKNLSS